MGEMPQPMGECPQSMGEMPQAMSEVPQSMGEVSNQWVRCPKEPTQWVGCIQSIGEMPPINK